MLQGKSKRTILAAAALVVVIAVVASIYCYESGAAPGVAYAQVPFEGDRAYQHLQDVCAIGPRVSGTAGMAKQQALLRAHFEAIGGEVLMQEFDVRHPETGNKLTMANMIVRFTPERKDRIIICGHYDTRPFPDRDPRNPKGVFVGANDGGSGVAVMMELGRYLPELKSTYGVDLVFFDGEELIYNDRRDPYFLGSEYFAKQYVANPHNFTYRAGVLLDMVGDADLQIYQERNSLTYARSMVQDVWSIARKLGVREFIPRMRHEVRDDHLALNRIAKIPTIDIIDFDYPRPGQRRSYWHTQQDVPANCSAESLEKVGKVVHEWLRQLKPYEE